MTKKLSTFKQRQYLDSLQKELGITIYDEIKHKLRIKKPITEISSTTARRFIQSLIEYKNGKFNSDTITDMKKALNRLRRNKRAFEERIYDELEDDFTELVA